MLDERACPRGLVRKRAFNCQALHGQDGKSHELCTAAGYYSACEHKALFDFNPVHVMKINEIYNAISGEGATAGRVCTIVRVSGCNLRCSYCDTTYAYDAGIEMSTSVILDHIEMDDVLYTGGEPLYLKDAALNFLKALQVKRKRVFVETNGSIDIRPFTGFAHLVMDIKTPSSKMHKAMLFENIKFLDSMDEIKFVVADKLDYDYANRIVQMHNALSYTKNIYISPAWGNIEFIQELSKWMIADKSNMLLSLQQHKIIWPPEKRGV